MVCHYVSEVPQNTSSFSFNATLLTDVLLTWFFAQLLGFIPAGRAAISDVREFTVDCILPCVQYNQPLFILDVT